MGPQGRNRLPGAGRGAPVSLTRTMQKIDVAKIGAARRG